MNRKYLRLIIMKTEAERDKTGKETADEHLMLMSVVLPSFKFLLSQECMIYCSTALLGFESVISF